MSFWKGKRVLVTGGAGFVGSHVVERLCRQEARVRVADNLSTGHRHFLDKVSDQVELLEVDLREREHAVRAVVGQDVVINMAGFIAGIGYNANRQTDFFVNNMMLQQWILLAARDARIPLFSQVSSACVYPKDAPVPTPEASVDIGPPEPSNQGYGWGKRMGEELARFVAAESEMKVAILRFFNIYGPRDCFDVTKSHVIPALVERCLGGEPVIQVWGSGNQTRSFVYVEDMADLILEVTEKYPQADPINLGTPTETSMRDLVEMIVDITGSKAEIHFDTSKPEGYARRAPDLSKLYGVLGREPSAVSLREGLERVVHYRRSMLAASPS
ncbi:MAG: NAD-dependent epimerase/dehydratase family protein [Planctomycetales bacterium]|nr:NAD-dependent epimerase/dehydratase family protein [Planctomycetales bacterium]